MLPVPEEHDSTVVIMTKLVLIILTIFIAGAGAVMEGVRILKFRFRKNPQMGFTKDV